MARVRKVTSIFKYLHRHHIDDILFFLLLVILVIIIASHNKNLISKCINREKYHADSVENPIRDLVLGECFDEVHHPSEPFVRSLTGEEILTALCEKKCNVSQQYKHYGKNPKTFCSGVFVLK